MPVKARAGGQGRVRTGRVGAQIGSGSSPGSPTGDPPAWVGPAWSPTDHSEFITISGTYNETATRNSTFGGTRVNCKSDTGQTTGTRYAEFIITNIDSGDIGIGVCTGVSPYNNGLGLDNFSYGYNSSGNQYYQGGFAPTSGALGVFTTGDTIGIEVNLDANTIRAKKNGGTFTATDSISAMRPSGAPVFLAASVNDTTPFTVVTFNNV